jgi:hypothetical protein
MGDWIDLPGTVRHGTPHWPEFRSYYPLLFGRFGRTGPSQW